MALYTARASSSPPSSAEILASNLLPELFNCRCAHRPRPSARRDRPPWTAGRGYALPRRVTTRVTHRLRPCRHRMERTGWLRDPGGTSARPSDGRPAMTWRTRRHGARRSGPCSPTLALAERPPTRQQLAEPLFADAEDPGSALRWNLSQLRRLLGGPDTVGSGNTVGLRLPAGLSVGRPGPVGRHRRHRDRLLASRVSSWRTSKT